MSWRDEGLKKVERPGLSIEEVNEINFIFSLKRIELDFI